MGEGQGQRQVKMDSLSAPSCGGAGEIPVLVRPGMEPDWGMLNQFPVRGLAMGCAHSILLEKERSKSWQPNGFCL